MKYHEVWTNKPFNAIAYDASAGKRWKLNELDADHVTAWSKGGATDI